MEHVDCVYQTYKEQTGQRERNRNAKKQTKLEKSGEKEELLVCVRGLSGAVIVHRGGGRSHGFTNTREPMGSDGTLEPRPTHRGAAVPLGTSSTFKLSVFSFL